MYSFGLPKANGSIRRPTRSVESPGKVSAQTLTILATYITYYAVLTHGILSFRLALGCAEMRGHLTVGIAKGVPVTKAL